MTATPQQEERYRTMTANGGEKTVLLEGWVVKAVFVDGDHAAFAAEVCRRMNQEQEQ